MFLREYVYVDVDRVNGLASQLYDGVPERATNVAARHRKFELDLKLARGGAESGTEDSTERNLADSIFKDLEADLESLGLLEDVSEQLGEEAIWQDIESLITPGQILRITAPGTLFHPAQMSEAIVGMATAAVGAAEMGLDTTEDASPSVMPPKAKSEAQKRAERSARQPQYLSEPQFPEDYLPESEFIPLMAIPRKNLSGMIKITRGTFGERCALAHAAYR